METRKNKFAYDRNYYENIVKLSAYEGNAARKLYEADPEYDEPLYDEVEEEFTQVPARRERKTPDRRHQEQHESELRTSPKVKYVTEVNLLHITMFVVAMAALVFVSFKMLGVKSAISQTDKLINTANIKLNDIEAMNMSLEAELDIELDRNYIYSIAVGQLGMKYPSDNQVVYYSAVESEYVRQYAIIP